jgi:ADP-ribosylglycohydrolase
MIQISAPDSVTRSERIAGGLIGLLVGDALGVPYEFYPASALPPTAQIEMTPPPGFSRSHGHVEPGTWSDDGAQALCLLASLLYCDSLDLDDFGRRLLNWCDVGYLAVGGNVFDVGITTSLALSRLRAGRPAMDSGLLEEGANGNGSLMRVLPLALWHRGTDAELALYARHTSLPTHAHLRAQLCCALYCLWARRILESAVDPWDAAVDTLRTIYEPGTPERAELEGPILGFQALQGSGYVVDSLHSANWAVQQGGYESAVKAAISLGNDTDTTACIAGGIAGLLHGVRDIPHRWRDSLREYDVANEMLVRLLRED